MKQKVAVLGPGSWGTALAQVLAEMDTRSVFGEINQSKSMK